MSKKQSEQEQPLFTSWGWLSIDEIAQGLTNLGIAEHVDIHIVSSLFNPDGLELNRSCIVLTRRHYVVYSNINERIVFFDPLNQGWYNYTARNTSANIDVIDLVVQPHMSAHCGNYCLFYLHYLYNRIIPNGINSIQYIRDELKRYLFTCRDLSDPSYPNTEANTVFIENFSGDYQIGEEFYRPGYSKFYFYMKELSRAVLGK